MADKLPDDAISQIVKSTPPGVWIWHLDSIRPNYLAGLAGMKCRRVYLKVFDDLSGPSLLSQAQRIPDFVNAGISVVGWGYHFDQREDVDISGTGARIRQAMALGLDGYIADLEKEVGFAHVFPAVEKLLSELRDAVGAKFLGYSSFGQPGFHPEMPWHIFDDLTDLAFPQIYFEKWRGASWGHDDESRVRIALKAHRDLGLKNPILPIWGSEEDTRRPASAQDLQPYLARFPGSSIFRIPNVGEQGVAWTLNYTAPATSAQAAAAIAQPATAPTAGASGSATSQGPLSLEQMTQIALGISGRFEGDDPWANITGNFDGEGLTCGMLGKTFANGEQQSLIQDYTEQFGTQELLALMPRTGAEYLKLCALPPAQATPLISKWSKNGNSETVEQPYLGELQRFWKSAKMVSIQTQAAMDNEGGKANDKCKAWGLTNSLHAFCFFFDIATQGGSIGSLVLKDVQDFFDQYGGPAGACGHICSQCQAADENARANAEDAHKNGALWKTLIDSADLVSTQLFVLGWLRSARSRAKYVFTAMNRRGTLALERGYVDMAAWDFRQAFGTFTNPVAQGLNTIPSPAPATAAGTGAFAGRTMQVAASSLNLRSSPGASSPANLLVSLPAGQLVQVMDSSRADGWWRVSTNFRNSVIEGCVASRFLSEVTQTTPGVPAAAAIVAVNLAATAKLDQPPNAHPLDEPAAPHRAGGTLDERCADLGRIIAFLNVRNSLRYQPIPRPGPTYCNIYAYDYCNLAGVYLPRVWWTDSAIKKLLQHQTVAPLLDTTVNEMRANDIEVWFDQYGIDFGWRHTLDPNELQTAANQGSVGIIVARNRNDSASGHIVAVPPETALHKAHRTSSGVVDVPLQSQAGRNNFQYGVGGQWWKTSEFVAFGLWFHA